MAVVLKPVASPRHLKPGKKDKTARSGDQKCGGVMAIASERAAGRLVGGLGETIPPDSVRPGWGHLS